MTLLEPVLAWDVPHAAAAVVGSSSPLNAIGDQDRPFALASVTKPLVAYAVLVAVEEGTLDLDEAAGPPGATVRHLLAHTAGYSFDGPPMTPPGRSRIYSNTGFEALGDHLAGRAGMPVAEYLAAGVLEPLRMDATELRGSPAKDGWSTVDDLTRFAGELLRPTLIAPATLAAATTVAFPGLAGMLPGIGRQDPNDWGLGFELKDHKAPHWTGSTNSERTFGHFGGAGTFLWVDPDLATALVVLTDREFGPWALEAWPALSDAVVAAHRP